MRFDPFTLVISLDTKGEAHGTLYLDDGETYSNKQGHVVWRQFSFSRRSRKENWLTSGDYVASRKTVVDGFDITKYNPENPFAKSIEGVKVEKIIVLGLPLKPTGVQVSGGDKIEYTWEAGSASTGEGVASVLTLKNPGVLITEDWAISFTI